MGDHYFDLSIELDYEAAQYRRRELVMREIERRIEYWREKQETRYLELYRTIASI